MNEERPCLLDCLACYFNSCRIEDVVIFSIIPAATIVKDAVESTRILRIRALNIRQYYIASYPRGILVHNILFSSKNGYSSSFCGHTYSKIGSLSIEEGLTHPDRRIREAALRVYKQSV